MSRDLDREDLAVTAEAIRNDARRIAAIEERKLEDGPDDPAAVELSAEAVRIAERIREEAHAEQAITQRHRQRRPTTPN